MKNTLLVLTKVIVQQFYSRNASLFFFVIAFALGFIRSHDHLALGQLMISSWVLLLIPSGVWLLYGLFLYDFNHSLMKENENQFLFHFRLFYPFEQWVMISVIAVQLFAPVILYSIFLILLSIKNELVFSALQILATLLLLLSILAFQLRNILLNPNTDRKTSSLQRLIHHSFARPYNLLVFEGVLKNQVLAVLGYKVASMILLWATLKLYETDTYDIRLLGMAVTISFSLSISFITEWHMFENRAFSIIRRMPFSLMNRFANSILILLLFFSSEGLLLFQYKPPNISYTELISVCGYGLSIGLFWYCFHFINDKRIEKIVSYVSMVSICSFILVLASVSMWFLFLVNTLTALFLFTWYYRNFEYVPVSKELE